jgi:hypothetical protein
VRGHLREVTTCLARALCLSVKQYRVIHPDPTRLITFRDFLENRQGLDCDCPGCRRTAYTDVAMLIRNGLETDP